MKLNKTKIKLTIGHRKSENSAQGFTLIEVMLAVSLTLIITLGIAEIMINAGKEDLRAKLKSQFFSGRQEFIYQNKVAPAPSPDP